MIDFQEKLKKLAELSIDVVNSLEGMSKRDRGILRRNRGRSFEDAQRSAILVFYRLLPNNELAYQRTVQNACWMVATLFAGSKSKHVATGEDLGAMCKQYDDTQEWNGIQRRFENMLSQDIESLAPKLRNIVDILEGKGFVIDWQKMLYDLARWHYNKHVVQHDWAKSYVGFGCTEENKSEDN